MSIYTCHQCLALHTEGNMVAYCASCMHALKEARLKMCWWCEHFRYTNMQDDWSDETPGYAFAISCGKGIWDFDSRSDSQERFGEVLSMAQTCVDFEKK